MRIVLRALLYTSACVTFAFHLSGCAVFDDPGQRTLRALDEKISPESTATQIALAPVGIVVGNGALAVDAFVVNPAMGIGPAFDDTYDLLWKPRDLEPLQKAMLFGPVVVATPPAFVISWYVHSFFED